MCISALVAPPEAIFRKPGLIARFTEVHIERIHHPEAMQAVAAPCQRGKSERQFRFPLTEQFRSSVPRLHQIPISVGSGNLGSGAVFTEEVELGHRDCSVLKKIERTCAMTKSGTVVKAIHNDAPAITT